MRKMSRNRVSYCAVHAEDRSSRELKETGWGRRHAREDFFDSEFKALLTSRFHQHPASLVPVV
jgi:hypothetical protein